MNHRDDTVHRKHPIAVIGAGPAGLAAAHRLIQLGQQPLLIEKEDKPGGLSRTEFYKSYLFDIGGHRFFTKLPSIQALWQGMLGQDFIEVSRKSRIFYQHRFYDYPLNMMNTLTNLGIRESTLILGSYLKSQLKPYPREDTFEQWIVNRFGQRLYRAFFKTYTEKVWGMPCSQIISKWAAQRIRGLSLSRAVMHALMGGQQSKTLIDRFQYPRKGPAMMWQRFVEAIGDGNGKVLLNARLSKVCHESGRLTHIMYEKDTIQRVKTSHVISTLPISRLVSMMDPQPPEDIQGAAARLSYRSFVIVMLIIDQKELFPDQWIYIHNPEVRVGRIQNFKNWSKEMVPDPGKTSIGMEYFCNQGDAFWCLPDDQLTGVASSELAKLALAKPGDIIDSYVVRQPDAYPVYDQRYEKNLRILRAYVDTFDNLQTIGRNGMHRYNNMDHSMQSGILAAENALGAGHDLWEINEEDVYLES